MGYRTRAIVNFPKAVPGLGNPSRLSTTIAARTRRTNYRLTGLGKAPLRRAGGPRIVIRRRGLRGLGDCMVIDPVTGGRVTYPSGDPHCGPTPPPPPPPGGGGSGGCGLKPPLCPGNLRLIGGTCWAKDAWGNDVAIRSQLNTVPPPCGAGTGEGELCVYPDCMVAQMDRDRYSKFYQPRFPLCSTPGLTPGAVCVDANGNVISYQPPLPPPPKLTCVLPQVLDSTGTQCVTPAPAPTPIPTPTPTPATCTSPMVLDSSGACVLPGNYTVTTPPPAPAVTSSVSDFMTQKLGPLPLWGWAAGVAGAWFLFGRRR